MQVGLTEWMKDFCVFRVGPKLYRYRVLPFALASAPRDFSKMVRKIIAVFRKVGIRVTLRQNGIHSETHKTAPLF